MALRDVVKGMSKQEAFSAGATGATAMVDALPVERRVGRLKPVDAPGYSAFIAPTYAEQTVGAKPGIVDILINPARVSSHGLSYPADKELRASVDLSQLALDDPTVVQDLLFNYSNPQFYQGLPADFDTSQMVQTAEGYLPDFQNMNIPQVAEFVQNQLNPLESISMINGTPLDYQRWLEATQWAPRGNASLYQNAMVTQNINELWNTYYTTDQQLTDNQRQMMELQSILCSGFTVESEADMDACVQRNAEAGNPEILNLQTQKLELTTTLGTTASTLLELGVNPDDFSREQTWLSKLFGWAGDLYDHYWGDFQFQITDREALAEAALSWTQGKEGRHTTGELWTGGYNTDPWRVGQITFASFTASSNVPGKGGIKRYEYTPFDENNPDHVMLKNSIQYVYEHGYAKTGHHGKRAVFDYLQDLTVTGLRQIADEVTGDVTNITPIFGGAAKNAIAFGFDTMAMATRLGKAERLVHFGAGAAMLTLDEGQFFFINRGIQGAGWTGKRIFGPINKIPGEGALQATARAEVEKRANTAIQIVKSHVAGNNLSALARGLPVNQGANRTSAALTTKVINAADGNYESAKYTRQALDDPMMGVPDMTAGVPAVTRGRNGEHITYMTAKEQEFTPAPGTLITDPAISHVKSGNNLYVRNQDGNWNVYVSYKAIDDVDYQTHPEIVAVFDNEQMAAAVGIKAPLFTTADVDGDSLIRMGGISQDPAIPENMVVRVVLNDGTELPNLPIVGNLDNIDTIYVDFVNENGVVSNISTIKYVGSRETGHINWRSTSVNKRALPNLGDDAVRVSDPDADFQIWSSFDPQSPYFLDTEWGAAVGTGRVDGRVKTHTTGIRGNSQQAWDALGSRRLGNVARTEKEFLVVTVNNRVVPVKFYDEEAAAAYIGKLQDGETWLEALPNAPRALDKKHVFGNVHETIGEAVSSLMYKHKEAGFYPKTESSVITTVDDVIPPVSLVDEGVETVVDDTATVVTTATATTGRVRPNSALAKARRRERAEQNIAKRQARLETGEGEMTPAGTTGAETTSADEVEITITEPTEPWEDELADQDRRNTAADNGDLGDPDSILNDIEADPDDPVTQASIDPNVDSQGRVIDPLDPTRMVHGFFDRESGTFFTIDDDGLIRFVDNKMKELASDTNPLSAMRLEDIRLARRLNTMKNYAEQLGMHFLMSPITKSGMPVLDELGQPMMRLSLEGGRVKDLIVKITSKNLLRANQSRNALRNMVKSIDLIDEPFPYLIDGELRLMQPIGVRRSTNSWVFGLVDSGPAEDIAEAQNRVRSAIDNNRHMRNSNGTADYNTPDAFIDNINQKKNGADATTFVMDGMRVYPVSMMGAAAEQVDESVVLGFANDISHHKSQLIVLDVGTNHLDAIDGPLIMNEDDVAEAVRHYNGAMAALNAGEGSKSTAYFGWNQAHDVIHQITKYLTDSISPQFLEGVNSAVSGILGNTVNMLNESSFAIRKLGSYLPDIDSYASTQLSNRFFDNLRRGVTDPANDPFRILQTGISRPSNLIKREIFWNVAVGTTEGLLFERIVQNLSLVEEFARLQGLPGGATVDILGTVWRVLKDPEFIDDPAEIKRLIRNYTEMEGEAIETYIDILVDPIVKQFRALPPSAGAQAFRSVDVMNQRILRTFEVAQLVRTKRSLELYVRHLAKAAGIDPADVRKIALTQPAFIESITDPLEKGLYDIVRRLELATIELERTATIVDFGYRNTENVAGTIETGIKVLDARYNALYADNPSLIYDPLVNALEQPENLVNEIHQSILDGLLEPMDTRLSQEAQRLINDADPQISNLLQERFGGGPVKMLREKHPHARKSQEAVSASIQHALIQKFHFDAKRAAAFSDELLEDGEILKRLHTPVVSELLERMQHMQEGTDVFTHFFATDPEDILSVLYAVPEARIQIAQIVQMLSPNYSGPMDFVFENLEAMDVMVNPADFEMIVRELVGNAGYLDFTPLGDGSILTDSLINETRSRRFAMARKDALSALDLEYDKTSRFEIGDSLLRPGTLGEDFPVPGLLNDPNSSAEDFADFIRNDHRSEISQIDEALYFLFMFEDGRIPFGPNIGHYQAPYQDFSMYSGELGNALIENQPITGSLVNHAGHEWTVSGSIPVLKGSTGKGKEKTKAWFDYAVVLTRMDETDGAGKLVKRVELWRASFDKTTRNLNSTRYQTNRWRNNAMGTGPQVREMFEEAQLGRAFTQYQQRGQALSVPIGPGAVPAYDPGEINIVGLFSSKFPEKKKAGKDSLFVTQSGSRRSADISIENRIGTEHKPFKRDYGEIVIGGRPPDDPSKLRPTERSVLVTPQLGLMEGMIIRVRRYENGVYADLYSPVPYHHSLTLDKKLPLNKVDGHYHITSIHIPGVQGDSISSVDVETAVNNIIGNTAAELSKSGDVRTANSLDHVQKIMTDHPSLSPRKVEPTDVPGDAGDEAAERLSQDIKKKQSDDQIASGQCEMP